MTIRLDALKDRGSNSVVLKNLRLALAALVLMGCTQAGPPGTPGSSGLSGSLIAMDALGVFQYDFKTGSKQRFVTGIQPQRALNTETIYVLRSGTQDTLKIATPDGNVVKSLSIPFTYGGAGFPQSLDPALSPDGKLIAFAAQPFEVVNGGPSTDPFYHVYVMTRDGALLADLRGYAQPAWTPDGRLVYAGSAPLYDGETGIYISGADLKNPKRLDGSLSAPNSPAVSPDGKSVVFENTGAWVVSIDGGVPRKLYAGSTILVWPVFSPDGKTVAVSEQRGNSSWLDLKILTLDGSKDPYVVYTSDGIGVDGSSRLSWSK
jgi:Tol biopolymer transport system component